MPAENLAFVLTPPGAAAIAVVRLCGPATEGFLAAHFSKAAVVGRCVHGNLRNGSQIIDDPVVVLCRPGVADLNLHGGNAVIQMVLELAKADGFSVNDRIEAPLPVETIDSTDRIEIEVLQYLPLARTELAVRILLAQRSAWEKLEADLVAKKLSSRALSQILQDPSLEWLLKLPRVAIVGPANVGKSTVANHLFGQERSITADIPGTTRDWVGEIADIDGLAVMLIDTPGRRRASDDAIEQAAIAASRQQIAGADCVIVVMDQSEPRGAFEEFGRAILVANKADRPAAWDGEQIGAIPTVATTGEGVAQLRKAILGHFACENLSLEQTRCWTARQRQFIEAAINDSKMEAD